MKAKCWLVRVSQTLNTYFVPVWASWHYKVFATICYFTASRSTFGSVLMLVGTVGFLHSSNVHFCAEKSEKLIFYGFNVPKAERLRYAKTSGFKTFVWKWTNKNYVQIQKRSCLYNLLLEEVKGASCTPQHASWESIWLKISTITVESIPRSPTPDSNGNRTTLLRKIVNIQPAMQPLHQEDLYNTTKFCVFETYTILFAGRTYIKVYIIRWEKLPQVEYFCFNPYEEKDGFKFFLGSTTSFRFLDVSGWKL